MTNAFFYRNKYYLLPEDCANIGELYAKHRDGRSFAALELIEKKCMAPYFVKEQIKERKLTLRGEGIFPVQVELLSQKAYNLALREQIGKHCIGCPNFSPLSRSDSSLSGHHEEISLDGCCLIRASAESEDESFGYFDEWVKTFTRRFGSVEVEGKMRTLIDAGRYEDAAECFTSALAETAYRPVPPVYVGIAPDGRYRLAFTTVFEEQDGLLTEYLCRRLAKKYRKTWDIRNFIPKGMEIADAERPLGVAWEIVERERNYLDLTVYVEKGASRFNAYLWLAAYLGEDVLQSGAISTEIVESEGNEALRAPEMLEDIMKILLIHLPAESLAVPPVHLLPVFTSDEPLEEEEPEFVMARSLSGYFGFVDKVNRGILPDGIWENDDIVSFLGAPIACLSVTYGQNDHLPLSIGDPLTQDTRDLQGLLSDLRDRELFKVFSYHERENGAEISGLVLNLTQFLYALRRQTPYFLQNPAEVSIYTPGHTVGGRYVLGYEMKQIAPEEALWAALSPEDAE